VYTKNFRRVNIGQDQAKSTSSMKQPCSPQAVIPAQAGIALASPLIADGCGGLLRMKRRPASLF
jgi:hypothetical protein